MTRFSEKEDGTWGKEHQSGAGRRFPRHITEPDPDPAGLAGLVARLKRFFTRGVWLAETRTMFWPKRVGYKIIRVASLTLRGFVRDRCLFRAQALTFITVLSIVPLLAFTFSVAKGLGAYERLQGDIIEPFLDESIGERVVASQPPKQAGGGGPLAAPSATAEAETGTFPGAGGRRTPPPEEQAGAPAGPATSPGAAAEEDEGSVVEDLVFGTPPDGADEPAASAGSDSNVGLRETIDEVLGFVEKTDFASIGLFGLALLLYIVIKLLSSIEASFNEIWGVERPRSLLRKVSDYLSILVVVPILLIAAAGAMTAVKSGNALGGVNEALHIGPVVEEIMRFSSLFATWIGFAFIYLFMPNTSVRLFSALLGGILGGGLWLIVMFAYGELQVGMANYNAIYAGLAAIPIFLVWVNVSWITVLIGAELAFAHQNEPAFLHIANSRDEDQSFRERVGLRALVRLARAWKQGQDLPPAIELAKEMGVPERSLEEALRTLRDEGLLETLEGKDRRYAFAGDPGLIHIKDVLDALKGRREDTQLEPVDDGDRNLDDLLDRYEKERENSELNKSLSELL
ncbi:MAG: YhjD/YihY/BrkB family envelope integrity protein [Planctomycetota bacterium]|nr:YhjD/YihY/BrkB family envelope integrity protein [Planctomycetota bacterium]